MLHTYLICSMEPEQYEYENDNADSYDEEVEEDYNESEDYEELEDYGEDDSRDELYHDYMNEYDDSYEPSKEI